MHELDITYHNTYNCKSLRIEDNSIYDPDIQVKNPILEVKPPGLLGYIPFYLSKKTWKSITLNCSTLKLCCAKQPCKLTELPDGVYSIKYSIDPNLRSIVEFSHMRVCRVMASYIKVVGIFLSSKYTRPIKDNESIEKELLAIKDIIDASIYSVEELLDNQLGLELYEEAITRIKQISDGDFTKCCK